MSLRPDEIAPWAEWHGSAGHIWPAGRNLETRGLHDQELLTEVM